MALLGSDKGLEAENAARALMRIDAGSNVQYFAVLDAGALPGLVALLGSVKGKEAECAAGAFFDIAAGSNGCK